MKRKLIFFLLFAIFGSASFGQYVTIQGRQFKDENGDDFEPVVCNYSVTIGITDTNDFSTTFISPYLHFYYPDAFKCNCQDSCDSLLRDDIKQMLYMGFNTVRIMGIHPYYLKPGFEKDCNRVIQDSAFFVPIRWDTDCTCTRWFALEEPFTNDTAQHLYEMIDHLISVISGVEYEGKRLKVILISGGAWGEYSHYFPVVYSEYLSSMTDAVSTLMSDSAKTTLMAYDLFNEPCMSMNSLWPSSTGGHSKQDVCEYVSEWYDSVKDGDSNHLVTLGGTGFLRDIWEYDLAIMKLDFYSAHMYPIGHPQYEDSTYFESALNQIYGHFYWLQNNSPIPWIIGETGFQAVDSSYFGQIWYEDKFYNGTITDQNNFADSITTKTFEYGGSGFSWWFYKDVGSGEGDGHGILKKHTTCGTNWPCDSILKPIWEVFEDFTPSSSSTCSEPPYYYDPYYHELYALSTPDSNIVSGYVVDQDSVPIKDAWIFAQTRLWDEITPEDTLYHFDDHYTFTDALGHFEIIPYDYEQVLLPNWNTIENIIISAPGCSRLNQSAWEDSLGSGYDRGHIYVLDRFNFNIDETYESLTISSYDSVVLQAWDKISLTDVEVKQYAKCEVKARTEISVYQEFTAEYGSETWIHTENIYYPCDSLESFAKTNSDFFLTNETTNSKQDKEIKLNFTLFENTFDVRVYPNPGSGLFVVEILTDEPEIKLQMTVYNQYGVEVYSEPISKKQVSLNLSHLPRGIYFIQLINSEHQIARKIIII